jgi:hypothetical protein
VLKELDIVDHGHHINKNESEDWVLFQISLLNHGLSPPPLEMEIEQTTKVHIFRFPHIGDLSFGTSSSSSSSSSERVQFPTGACIQAEVAQIQIGHFLLNANSIQGLSGAAVVCDQSGGIMGIICGQWKGYQAFAVNIHRLPIQKSDSPPSSPDKNTSSKKRKAKSSHTMSRRDHTKA